MKRKDHHLIAVPGSGEGHLPAMIHLISHLAKCGKFSIDFILMNGSTYDSFKRKGWGPPANLPISVHLLEIDIPYPRQAITEHRLDLAAIHLYWRNFQEPLERFIQNLGSDQISLKCIVADYQLTWCVDVAENFGVSSALVFTGCLTWSWFELNLPRLAEQGLIPMQRDETPGEDLVLLEVPRLLRSDIPWQYCGEKEWLDYTIKFNISYFYRATWILSASVEELENKIMERIRSQFGRSNLTPIGPLFLLSDDPTLFSRHDSDTRCLEWLDQQPVLSVLYVAFGSLATLTIRQLEELARGIEASEQKFLWVARQSPDHEKTEFYKRFSERNKHHW